MAHYGYGPRFPYPWAMCSKLMIACRTVSLPEAACLSLPGTRGIRAAIPHARRNSSLGLHGGCGWSALCKDARDVGIRFSSTPKLCQTSACLHVRCDDTRPVRCHEMIGLNAVRRVHSSLVVARPPPFAMLFPHRRPRRARRLGFWVPVGERCYVVCCPAKLRSFRGGRWKQEAG